jgi:hypothetical protein
LKFTDVLKESLQGGKIRQIRNPQDAGIKRYLQFPVNTYVNVTSIHGKCLSRKRKLKTIQYQEGWCSGISLDSYSRRYSFKVSARTLAILRFHVIFFSYDYFLPNPHGSVTLKVSTHPGIITAVHYM